jgi:hypothetical protein
MDLNRPNESWTRTFLTDKRREKDRHRHHYVTRAAGEERRGGGKWREEGEGEGGFGKVVKVGRIYYDT